MPGQGALWTGGRASLPQATSLTIGYSQTACDICACHQDLVPDAAPGKQAGVQALVSGSQASVSYENHRA